MHESACSAFFKTSPILLSNTVYLFGVSDRNRDRRLVEIDLDSDLDRLRSISRGQLGIASRSCALVSAASDIGGLDVLACYVLRAARIVDIETIAPQNREHRVTIVARRGIDHRLFFINRCIDPIDRRLRGAANRLTSTSGQASGDIARPCRAAAMAQALFTDSFAVDDPAAIVCGRDAGIGVFRCRLD
jgi:hypothetical protein